MKIRYFLLFFLLVHFNASGQQIDSDSLIKEVKLKATNFFIEQGVLDKTNVKNGLDYVFITEIHDKKIIGYNTNGIYRIGVLISHSPQHILIKENSKFHILDLKNITEVLESIISYCERNKLNIDTMFLYIKEVMRMYEANYKAPIDATRLN